MKQRTKAILGRVAAVFSALPFAISSMSFSASADSNVRITASSLYSMLNGHVQGYYLADDDTFKPFVLTLSTSQFSVNWNYNLNSSYAGDLYTCGMITASAQIPSDLKLGSDSNLPLFMVDWNLHLSNVSYITTAAFNDRSSGYNNAAQFWAGSRSFFAQNNYWSVGSSPDSIAPLISRSNDSDLPGYFGVPTYTSVKYDCRLFHYDGDPIDIYFGTTYYGTASYTTTNYVYFGLVAPLINSDYVVVGNEGFPSPPASIGSGSGTIGSEDSEGNRPFNFEVVIPDYSSAINPSYDSSRLDEMGGDIDDYHSAESSLLDAANDGLSSVPDLELDSDLIEDAYNPLESFFGINIVGIMVFWVGAIAFISYILFGKWV